MNEGGSAPTVVTNHVNRVLGVRYVIGGPPVIWMVTFVYYKVVVPLPSLVHLFCGLIPRVSGWDEFYMFHSVHG